MMGSCHCLAHNSAFLGEILNYTLTKAFITCNSTRYAVMFFDMSQLCDMYELTSSVPKGYCICGHYVLKPGKDVVADTSGYYHIMKSDFSELVLRNLSTNATKKVSSKENLLPCVTVITKDDKKRYIPMHANVNQYI